MKISKYMVKGKKGRPIGYKLSEASKRAISEAKRGQKHKESTKSKISKSLKNYFRRKHPLSDEIANNYCRMSDDTLCSWLHEVSDDLDDCVDVLTQRTLYNKLKIEISYGTNIEDIFSHSITPEILLMYKEHIESENLNGNEED